MPLRTNALLTLCQSSGSCDKLSSLGDLSGLWVFGSPYASRCLPVAHLRDLLTLFESNTSQVPRERPDIGPPALTFQVQVVSPPQSTRPAKTPGPFEFQETVHQLKAIPVTICFDSGTVVREKSTSSLPCGVTRTGLLFLLIRPSLQVTSPLHFHQSETS
jgi:hypothetical protein